MYKVKHPRPARPDYDLIVIGSGSGGNVTAEQAARAGKKVAVIEMDTIGGECPNYGCVPTKALLEAAETYENIKRGAEFGIKAKVSVDYPAVRRWKRAAVKRTGTTDGEEFFASQGIKVIRGHAHFLSPWTVSVNGKRYSARNFLLATGTRPVAPPIPGLADVGHISFREAIELQAPPSSLFVIGGGAIGCEFAQLFNTFGTKVHLVDIAPRLIPLEDSEVGELLAALFEARGIAVQTGVKVTRVTKKGKLKVVHFEKDGVAHQAAVEEILVAAGMAPNTDMGLENAGVRYNRGGIITNRRMQTSAKHIYAAGDVVGPYRFTHTAAYQSRIAAHNLLHRSKPRTADYRAIPRCVFVEPEVACVGLTEQQLKEKGIKFHVGAAPISVIGRSNTSGHDSGFVKVLADKRGVLLGASIVSPRAGEMIHELTLAIQYRMTARQVAETIHAFPTWSETVRLACRQIKSK